MDSMQEKAQAIRIIFFDIDDTLRNSKTGELPQSAVQAFKELRAQGILTGIATGRNFYGVVPEIRALHPDFFVTANGAHVETGEGHVVYDSPIAPHTVKEIVSWLSKQGSDIIYYGADKVIASAWNALIAEAIVPIYGKLPVDADYYQTHSVYQVLSIGANDKELKLPSELTDKVRMVRWNTHSSDIVPLTGSKADGVSRILDRLGLTAANVMNFGDGPNDRELFEFSGLSVAMGNSSPEILKLADVITEPLEADGVYKALKTLKII